MRVLNIETPTHGRVLVEDAAVSMSRGWLIGFHGYGESADDIFGELRTLNAGGHWSIAAPQGLHRFYTRGDQRIVASWMTREDRDLAIADNVEYVNRLGSGLALRHPTTGVDVPLIYVGFSQGASMAYRAAVLGRHPASGVVALGGDIPPEVRSTDATTLRQRLPRVLIGAGTADAWFTAAAAGDDANRLAAAAIPHQVIQFAGGHEWTDEFRDAARVWLNAPGGPER